MWEWKEFVPSLMHLACYIHGTIFIPIAIISGVLAFLSIISLALRVDATVGFNVLIALNK